MKSFEKWKTQEVKRTFGLKEAEKLPELEDWLGAKHEISEEERKQVLALQNLLKKFVNYWNEEDIKVFFIIPLLQIVNFYVDNKYRPFTESTFSVELLDVHNNIQELRGRVEFLVATGEQIPEKPFFFVNEYKPHLGTQNDPQGQLLVTMLASQALNHPVEIPVYGLYTIGRNWYFMALAGNHFSQSKQYDTTDDHLIWDVFSAIKQVKIYIEENYQKVTTQDFPNLKDLENLS
jgi:hypothetical protein